MVELSTKKVQEPPEESMRRKRKTAVDVGGEQNALTRSRLGTHLPLRQPCRSLRDYPNSASSSRSACRIEDRIQSPWIQPGDSPTRDDDPRCCFLPFATSFVFFTRSSATVLSFTMVTGQRRQSGRVRCGGEAEKEEGREDAHSVDASVRSPYKRLFPSD